MTITTTDPISTLPKTPRPVKKQGAHYVNNKEFSQAVVDYVTAVNAAKAISKDTPRITEYIGRCILKISEGLSHKPNFIRYTYREEMVMDAVENCVKAIMNYNIAAATRTGSPNAFAYFTQICYYAFLRRIMKEKKQQDIKFRYIEFAGIENFMASTDADFGGAIARDGQFIDVLKKRIDRKNDSDTKIKNFKKKSKNDDKQTLELFTSSTLTIL